MPAAAASGEIAALYINFAYLMGAIRGTETTGIAVIFKNAFEMGDASDFRGPICNLPGRVIRGTVRKLQSLAGAS